MKEISKREKQYLSIVEDILENKEFLKTRNISHHGLDRYEHSGRVSYYSYRVAKTLRLDYVEVARAGLLHDFFLVNNNAFNKKEKMATLVNHPKYAAAFSSKYFYLTEKEKDIILSHMFPVAINRVPKYAESWIVNSVDKIVAVCEALYSHKGYFMKYLNVIVIVLLNYLKI